MNMWACWSIPAFLTIGQTFSWLHSLPALAGFCVVIYLLWMHAMTGRRINSKIKTKFSAIITRASQSWKRAKRNVSGRADYAPIWFSVFVMAALAYGVSRQHFNVVTQHNVEVYRQLENGDWMMSSKEDPDLVFRPCPDDTRSGVDVNGLLSQAVGYVAETARWEERGTCKSILRSDLGFWFRDRANNFTYRRIE